jgi:hypothetical protein
MSEDHYVSLSPGVDIYGRQRLASVCTLSYDNHCAEFIASLPYASIFFLMKLNSNTHYPLSYKLACLSLFGVELTHSFGHLLQFNRAEEIIIFFYFWFNLFFMHIVYVSPVTSASWWRSIFWKREQFLLAYVMGAAALVYVWTQYGYLASTSFQCFIQLGVALSTSLSSATSRSYMHKWTCVYFMGVFLLVSEIIGCAYLRETLGSWPYHASVDLVMGISCYHHCSFICSLYVDDELRKNKK